MVSSGLLERFMIVVVVPDGERCPSYLPFIGGSDLVVVNQSAPPFALLVRYKEEVRAVFKEWLYWYEARIADRKGGK